MRMTIKNPGRTSLVALGLAAALGAPAAHAEDIAFIEASSELDDSKPASTMWNAVDGKPTTAWCSKPGNDAQNAILSFGFDKPVTVTHIGLVVGAVKGDALDKTKKRARIVLIGDAEHRVEAKFNDDAAMQILELTPPAKGRRVVVEIAGVYDGADSESPVCVGEVLLKQKGAEMTGASVAGKLRAMNTPSKRLLHEWLDDPSAPTRALLFNVDGTFTYSFEPLLEGKPVKLRGKWTAVDRSITLDVGGKGTRVQSRLTKIDDGDNPTVELVISGEPPHPSMAATFRPAPLRLH